MVEIGRGLKELRDGSRYLTNVSKTVKGKKGVALEGIFALVCVSREIGTHL